MPQTMQEAQDAALAGECLRQAFMTKTDVRGLGLGDKDGKVYVAALETGSGDIFNGRIVVAYPLATGIGTLPRSKKDSMVVAVYGGRDENRRLVNEFVFANVPGAAGAVVKNAPQFARERRPVSDFVPASPRP